MDPNMFSNTYSSGPSNFNAGTTSQAGEPQFDFGDNSFYPNTNNSGLMSDADFHQLLTGSSDMTGTMTSDFSFADDFMPGMQLEGQELIPAQHFVDSSAMLTTPPQQPTSAPAAQVQEPLYHPEIGWYYPAATPVAVPPPAQVEQPRGTKRKVYFGPAAFEAASKRVKSTSPDPDQKAEKPKKIKKPRNARGRDKYPSIEMPCVCGTTGPKRQPPRPRNAFIIFRSQNAKIISRDIGTTSHPIVSKEAGARWKALGTDGQARYKEMAEREKVEHARIYPDYKYKPNRTKGGHQISARFGDPTCSCGAYQKNVAKWKAETGESPRFESSDGSEDGNDESEEPETLDEYVPPRSAMNTYQAPLAQMTAPVAPLPDVMPDYGFATQTQQDSAAAMFAQLQAAQQAAAAPQTIRRSTRNQAPVSYAEPSMDDFESYIASSMEPAETFAAPSPEMEGRAKRRPSSIMTPSNSPPSHNTRSRSRASIDLPTIEEGNAALNFDDLFGENGHFDDASFFNFDDAADTIHVASRRNSSRRPSRHSTGSKGKESSMSQQMRRSGRISMPKSASPSRVEKRRGSSSSTARVALRRSSRHSPRQAS
ncbi:hypothetical protein KC332_g14044 [Hortaea werneckii]|uniref:HMG box domain-containing protein n=1 Tax=Hortaea werneckii TaxID=91943 RepID=A0A3M7IRV4_HORWE|nr:hypothetical protein KC358_g16244 [Hortaea werneckii]KAI6801351.1 hypothetical protein KC350_g15662 [Hortaea werneckii]KAI6905739.1 hypothetical protein KC348_g14898 [Hortaea werneckii]KAI6923041.1 hypothetical protein KC341_g15005 [Hortaea werneckii]KAI6954449.1 hypothetical protein KC321_g16359 [Hortaea werneckii]